MKQKKKKANELLEKQKKMKKYKDDNIKETKK